MTKQAGTSSLIGVDLGGTNIRAGKVKNDEIENLSSRLIPKTNNPEEVTRALVATIREVLDPEISGIGIGIPGLVDMDNGMVYSLQNIPAYRNIRIGYILEKEFNMPVYVNNDANCFAVGEHYYGSGRKHNDFVGLITGTGLGAGIIKNGHLVSGQNCGAGEFGLIPYLDHNLEFYTSGTFFTHFYKKSAYSIALEAKSGDESALAALKTYGKHLGACIKVIMAVVDPAAIIIGGGISNAFDLYKEAMWTEVRTFEFAESADRIEIVASQLAEIAILGAASLYHDAVRD